MTSEINMTSSSVGTEKISAYHWLMFIICFFGNIMGGTISTLMSVYLPVVVKDLLGSVDQLNQVSAYINALYFVGWAIGGLAWGFLADRIGRIRSLAMSIGMFGVSTVLVGFSSSWETVVILRFICGFGVGGMMVVNTTLLSETWPEKTRAIFIGMLSIGFPVGIFSSGAVNFFVSGWQQGFMVGILPTGIAVIIILLLKESEKWKASRGQAIEIKTATNLMEYQRDLINGSIIFGCMLIGLWAVFAWVPTWVQSLMSHSDGQRERSLSMMLLGIGGLSGGFCSGWIANALGTRKAMLLCFSACFVLSFLLFRTNTSFTTVTLVEIGVLALMFGISQGLLGVYIPLLFPISIRASATGFCFNIGRFFTAATVYFIGTLVATFNGYGNSLFIFSFVFLVGFIFLFFSKKITN